MSRASVAGAPAFSNKNPSDAGQFTTYTPKSSIEGRLARKVQEQSCNFSFNLPLFSAVLITGNEVVQRRMLEMAKSVIEALSERHKNIPTEVTAEARIIHRKIQ